VTVLSIIREGLDALLHPSARYHALMRARHRAFTIPRLLGGLTVLAAFPVHLAMQGVPAALEAAVFGCLTASILLSWFLSRTARYEEPEDRYRLLALSMSGVISCHHRDGGVQFISPAAEAMLGTPVAQLLGHGLFDRVNVADRPAYLTALSDAACGGEVCGVEFRVRRNIVCDRERRQGNSVDFIWVEMRCKALGPGAETASPSQEGVVAVLREVTERKNQEQALDLARTAAEQAEASRARFLATMSHELRTPLNAIIGFSEMIIQEDALMLDAARRKEYAQLINDSGQHLLSVVNGILDISKMESGNFEITPEPFSPRDALLNCCNLLALKARDNAIDLVTRAPDDLPVMNGDPRAFRQIALNLVSNAIKFTERGGTVTVSAAVEGSRLVLRVADNGVGIAADDLKRIGDPFFQAGKTYERRHEGTGLGLSIVKSLVALHGGDMAVRSRVDEGTTVTVALPLTLTPPAAPSSKVATLTPLRSAISDRVLQVKRSA
jgi:two-component system, cell cycle sensor histidine kinase DivJ